MTNWRVLGLGKVEIKPLLICASISIVLGLAVEYFTGFYWLTASLLAMVALLINGMALFAEDFRSNEIDSEAGSIGSQEARKVQKRAMRCQGLVIIVLFLLAIWSYYAWS